MQFELTLKITELQGRGLPFSYQYLVSAWIYKQIQSIDPSTSKWLHDDGFKFGSHAYKMFTFSYLQLQGDYRGKRSNIPVDKRYRLFAAELKLSVSFLLEEVYLLFIESIHKNPSGSFGDRDGTLHFQVESTQIYPEVDLKETMHLHTLSPVHVNYNNPRTNNTDFLDPEHKAYEGLLFNNLCRKYDALMGEHLSQEIFQASEFSFELAGTTDPDRRKITISKHRQETELIAYDFEFVLTAPLPLMGLALDVGLGKSNAQGFGMVGAVALGKAYQPRSKKKTKKATMYKAQK